MSAAAPPPDSSEARERAAKLLSKGDYADALTIYESLLKDAGTSGEDAANDLQAAINAVTQLGRHEDADKLRDLALASHPNSPRVKRSAAQTLLSGNHYGYVIDGTFTRGQQRRGGNWASSIEWDRVRAIQLLAEGLPAATADTLGEDEAGDYRHALASALLQGRQGNAAWQLQTLTDLTELPDRADPDPIRNAANPSGAPVTEDGAPLYHEVPASWQAAKTDGERWRWALAEAAKFGADNAAEATLSRAGFLEQQFGVGTLYGVLDDLLSKDGADAGPWALSTLKDTETIARLATGPKRFTLPDEHNHLLLYKSVGDGDTGRANQALQSVAGVYENRRQYPAAVKVWDRLIEKTAPRGSEHQNAVRTPRSDRRRLRQLRARTDRPRRYAGDALADLQKRPVRRPHRLPHRRERLVRRCDGQAASGRRHRLPRPRHEPDGHLVAGREDVRLRADRAVDGRT